MVLKGMANLNWCMKLKAKAPSTAQDSAVVYTQPANPNSLGVQQNVRLTLTRGTVTLILV